MLSNCEKMVAIPPQNQMGCSSGRVMEKAGEEELLLQQQQQLKCPRCDSSNTKFCYYNNYSLSQPRHFCKACKRYWTRGGTLRNIPVGGGCRSRNNKRFIKTPTTSSNSPSPTPHNYFSQPPQIDTTVNSTSKSHITSSLFYGLLSNNSFDANLPFSSFNNSSSTISSSGGYDLNGLGFSSSDHNGYGNGFSSLIFRSSSSTCGSSTSTPVMMPSLLSTSSNLVQHKFINHGLNLKDGGQPDHGTNNSSTFQGLAPLEQISNGMMKGEVEENRSLEWKNNGACGQNQMEHVGLFDPNSFYWNTASAAMGAWSSTDQANIGPSVTSLI